MTSSFTITEAATFTVTHARHIAAKVATDLKRMQRLYGKPSDSRIADYETEIVEFLRAGYLSTVDYGFCRNDRWIEPTLTYTARNLAGGSADDDDPGRVRPGADIENASFYSYLTYSPAWYRLGDTEKESFESHLPFQHGSAPEPAIDGYLSNDRTYSSGGRALNRASVRSY